MENSAAKVLPENTIVISSRGTVGEIGLLAEPMAFNQSCYGLISKDGKTLDQMFLYYSLKDAIGRLKGLAHGGVFDTFTKETFNHIEILAPVDPSKQKRIAAILSAFDDKIELNNKIDQTLEQMAQAIFKEWFAVPPKALAKECELQKGWETKNIMEIVKRLPVGKRYSNKTALPTGKVPILDQGRSGIIGFHNEEASIKASIKEPVAVFANHTCYYRLVTFDFSCIQNVIPFVGIDGYPTLFVYFLTKDKIKMSDYKGHWPEFEAQNFAVPPQDLAVNFSQKVQPSIEAVSKNEKENVKLASLRDFLLPKLMSGEVRVRI